MIGYRGKFFDFEGIDHAGKKTQSLIFYKKLKRVRPTHYLDYPNYSKFPGYLIDKYLASRVKFDRKEVPFLLHAADQVKDCEMIRNGINNGISWVSNRFFPSNIAYNVASGLNLNWILKVGEVIHRPDYGIFLDTPPSTGFGRNVGRRKKDINERDIEYQKRVYDAYWKMIDEKIFVKKWIVVDGNGTIDEVAKNLEKALVEIVPEIRRSN